MEMITSISNPKIKLAASLHKKKARMQTGCFIVEGLRLAEMAADSDWILEFALCTPDFTDKARGKALLDRLAAQQCQIFVVKQTVFTQVADTMTPQGIMLIVRQKIISLADVSQCQGGVSFIALAGVQDPGNAGTIIRLADAGGCTGVICLENTTDVFSDKCVRASMGSLFHIPVLTNVSMEAFRNFCQPRHIDIAATVLSTSAKNLFHYDYRQDLALIFGNEGNGISDKCLSLSDQQIYIPMPGRAESLNVAEAAAVVIYEMLRQRVYSQ